MLARWTNGMFASTPHRVLSPPTGSSRVSVPFFFEVRGVPQGTRHMVPCGMASGVAFACSRVLAPASILRASIPFAQPNYDALIQPIPQCCRETGGAPLYPPIMYGDHLYAKTSTNFVL